MKRGIIVGGLVTAAVAAGASPAAAAPCTPTPAGTAQLVDPPAVTGTVDASGCDIGVYYSSGGPGGTITGATIENARGYGVLSDGAGPVLISATTVQQIGDVPFNGVQRGVGIAYRAGGTGSVTDSTVRLYQKNGITVDGDGSDVDVANSRTTGLGPVSFIAQNGIQYSRGASGEIRDNVVERHDYTGCSNRDAAKTGCLPYVSTGILLYDVDPSEVDTSKNTYRDNQRNLYVLPSAAVS